MSATKCLREEHQVILRVLGFFTQALTEAQSKSAVTSEVFAPFIQFFRGFADHCHHCKEESRLFPALEDVGMPRDAGPIAVMLSEHQQGRALVARMAAALEAANSGDETARGEVLAAGREFVALLSAHIDKEDHVLFNMADDMLQGEASGALLDAYNEEESAAGYYETYRSCSQIVRDLALMYDEPAPPGSPLRVL